MPQQALKSTRSTKSPLFRFNTDGTIERVEKEPGVPFSPEEVQQSMDARQRLQNTVSLMKAPDADEAKKKDAKQLIANYLKAEFQWDQEARREQLDRLEKQIDLLKKQLTKREESQEKLIELRLQLLENDASGLSFPEAWANLSDGQSHWPTTGPNASGPPPSSPYPSPNVYGNGMIYRPSQNPNYPNPPIYSNPPAFPNKYPKQLPAPSAKP